MERDFWLRLWERGRVPFHAHIANPMLVAHLPALALPPGARVFVPLCGKTVDIGWLRARGFRVAGAELSALAVEQLFDSLGERPRIDRAGPLQRYSARDVEVWQGDIFDLKAAMLGPVDAVYDRAALIALPSDLRTRYAAHLVAISGAAPHLLMAFTRSGNPDDGPPFPVGDIEIRRLYAAFRITLLEDRPDEDPAERDQTWLLERPG